MATTQGTGIVWGTASTGLTYTASATVTPTGEDYAREADKHEIKGSDGNVKTLYFYNYRETLSLKCFPSGSSADATALPTIGEKVTVAASGDSQIAGDWIADSVSKSRSVDGQVEFDLGLIKHEDVTPA